jgi:hypothetical protein
MPENGRICMRSGRRQFLQAACSGAVVGIAAQAGVDFASPAMVTAQTDLSPDAALQELLAGNQRFAANQLTSFEHDLTILKERRVSKSPLPPSCPVPTPVCLWNSFLIRPLGTSSSRESLAIL